MKKSFDKNLSFLLAIDLDETLVFSYDTINKKNVDIIHNLYEKYRERFKLVFVSGRNFVNMKPVWNKYFNYIQEEFYIAINGAHVLSINNQEKEVLFQKNITIDESLINCLLRISSLNISSLVSSKSINTDYQIHIKRDLLNQYLNLNKNKIFKITGFLPLGFQSTKFYKTMLSLKNNNKISFYVHKEYSDYIEITAGGVKKSSGIEIIANMFNIVKSNIISIGNGPNDYPMLNNVPNSFLVGSHSLTKIPKHTIVLKNSCWEPFLSEVIKRLKLF